jgi:hypothetical protein
MCTNGSCARRRGWSRSHRQYHDTRPDTPMTINDGDLVTWMGWLPGVDAIIKPLLSDVGSPIGRARFNLLAGSRRPALGPQLECIDNTDESRRWVCGVVACFIVAFASSGATVPNGLSSASAVRSSWASFVGIFAPFMCTICVIRRLDPIYSRAGDALPVLSTAAEAGQLLNRSAVDSDPCVLVLASSLVGLIFGISGTIARGLRGMGHDIAACGTCCTETAPRQSTKHFRALVAASSPTHVAPTAPNNHCVGRLQPMYRATVYGKDEDVVVVASPVSTWREASSFLPPVWPEIDRLGWILGLVMGFAASLQGSNPNGGGCVIAAMAFVSLPSSDSAALLRIHTLQARQWGVVMVDTHRWLAVVHRGSALLTFAWPSSLHVLAGLLHHISNRSKVGLFVPSSPSPGALPSHTRRELRMLWPLLGDNHRSWRSEDSSPTIGWVTVRVEQPSTGLRAIQQHDHRHCEWSVLSMDEDRF